ncbi:hypothetical protein C1M55_21210 [Rhodococcus qingshengii]|uniref:glycine-rich domain-containing protein n=1 Tax=Rhodococcus TaxID=1827 RepID=UPI000978D1A3|nr:MULTISPECIES: hypothetical protein [Rhodococcus]AUS33359.1 hypothetical protein C1M55_21210 [Rhodococcus qingshengii]MCC4305767.1 hypothetical protein [Rhodococcus sp. 3-2]OMQ38026.1 hypothetical protein BK799_01115 [Rhodococcus sp. D-1]
MTAPDGSIPEGSLGRGLFRARQLETEEQAKARLTNGALGKWQGAQDKFKSDGKSLSEQLEKVNDHSRSIKTLVDQFNQLILQGNAIVYASDHEYTPTTGVTSIDVIILGAGGGGGAGQWNIVAASASGGGGGGGGGEVHTTIPATLLPKNADGTFKPIAITVGEGGEKGVGSQGAGRGGGDTRFGDWLAAGGGQGGGGGKPQIQGIGGIGGAGMIPGGFGGSGGVGTSVRSTQAGNSTSPYDLHGGGGGGGGGGTGIAAIECIGTNGGIGGISPGGVVGTPGAPGTPPSKVIATGGGGGGGGAYAAANAGDGAYPSGGGGGGAGRWNPGSVGDGGIGGAGLIFVIERMS